MPKKIKVIVTENRQLTREGYVALLARSGKVCVCGEAKNGQDLLDLLNTVETDIVILDVEMPVMSGIEVMKMIKKSWPKIKIIMLSFHNEDTLVLECVKMGAAAYLTKDTSSEELLEAIVKVEREGFYYTKNITRALAKDAIREAPPYGHLTGRETEITILVCKGKSNKEIARELNIVVKTVDYHKSNIYKKTRTSNMAGLYNYALMNNLIRSRIE